MKKIFLFCAAMLVAFAASAATINIDNTKTDALRHALNDANDGDEIVMAAGTYVESNSNYIAFDGKAVTVKAAEGAEVIIQPQVPITVTGGHAIFENVKIDASRLQELGTYEHLLYVTDGQPNGCTLRGCEIYGYNINSSMFYCSASNKVAAIKFENCYFHDIMKSILFIENPEGKPMVQVLNSTFANISTNTESYWAGVIDIRATEATLNVDHCTFYNVIPMNTDYSAVSKITLAKGKVSNCIFMLPTAQDGVRAMRGVTAENCITYNYLKDSGTGIHSSVTQSNCTQANPDFVYAEKGDYTLFKNSPATNYGTDGLTLGDARWYPKKVAMKGSWDEWAKQVVFEDAADGKTATAKMSLSKNMDSGYEFKMLNNGEWCNNEGFWFTHDGNKKADNVVPQVGDGNAMVLKAYKGEYTFTWTYETNSLEITFPSAEPKYYIHGSFNGWKDIEMTENAGILSATAELEADKNDYQFKIYKLDYLEEKTWYGAEDEINMMTKDNCTNWQLSDDQMDNWDIYLTSAKAGEYKFSFNLAEKKLSVIYPSETGISNTDAAVKAVKMMENGQLVIIKNGVRYDATGARL